MLQDFLLAPPWSLYLLLALFSLLVGSFLNVVIYRLPLMLQREWREQCCELLCVNHDESSEAVNLVTPRSFCPGCKAQVSWWQNIPVLSYLLLGGRCYHCKTSISLRYPMIELLTMLTSLYAAWHFGWTISLFFVLLALWLIIPMLFIDLDYQLLPDSLTLGLLWLGLIANTQALFTSLPVAVLSCAGAYLSLWLFIKLFYLLTGKVGMGHGDFKLFAAFGAWLGWMYLPLILMLSSICGAIVGILYLKQTKKTRDTPIPFGPFLCVAGVIALFWGETIMHWYLSLVVVH